MSTKAELGRALRAYVEVRGHKRVPLDEYDEEICRFGQVVQDGPMAGNKYSCNCGYNDLMEILEKA